MRDELGNLRDAEPEGKRDGDDQKRAAVQMNAGKDVDAGGCNRAEHDDDGTAEHRFRHGLDDAGHRREQP